MKNIILVLTIISLFSCSLEHRINKFCPNCPLKEKDSMVYIEKLKDTTIWIDNSEAITEMVLLCDSFNNVLVSEINELKSKGIKIVTKFKDNKIYLKAEVDSTAVYLQLKDKFKTDVKTETITIKEKYIPNIFWILGGICLVLSFILGFYFHKFITIKNFF